jgi:hypothetical protein
MTISTTCKGCGVELTAEDEDELVSAVQAHLAEATPVATAHLVNRSSPSSAPEAQVNPD